MRRLILITVAVAVVVMLSVPAAVYAQSGQLFHIVAPGETLSLLALRYGTTVGLIAHYNGIIDTSRIYVGQRLVIPYGARAYAAPVTYPTYSAASYTPGVTGYYTVLPGDTLTRIANLYNVTVSALASANGITNPNYIYRGQVLAIPYTPRVYQYYVGYGDTLARIAARYGTTVQSIASYNNLTNPNFIYPGQLLNIPV